jgi:hypothetical protein
MARAMVGGSVPRACQNGRETAVTSGHPWISRTASDLDTCRLTPCLKTTF